MYKRQQEDYVNLVENTNLTREQISDWGKKFRTRNKDINERLAKIDSEDPETVHTPFLSLTDDLLWVPLSSST